MDTKLTKLRVSNAHNAADAVAQAMRVAILHNTIPGGQVLRQEELAEQLGVSRLPVREALRQLHAEGLVHLAPHRGAMVTALSAADIREIYDIRVGLETTALRLALPHLSPAILQRAAALISDIDTATEALDWGALNWTFHATLYAAAQRPRLTQLIRTMHDNVGRYLRVYPALMHQQQISQQEHRALLDACRAQQEETALGLLRQHLEGASARLAAYIEQQATGCTDNAN